MTTTIAHLASSQLIGFTDKVGGIIALGGKSTKRAGIYKFRDGSMITDRGVEYIGGL